MTEIERYEPQQDLASRVDSWASVLGQVGDLATKIAGTDFVPQSMRGKPASVAAAILTGREVGVPPMTALANIHVIHGRPGMSAQLMRQLIYSAGHELRYVETTDTRCVVEGRRRGSEHWERVVFTADQARRAKIDLGGYPEDKLVARATSRLARRVFADVLGGLPYLPDEAAEAALDAGATTAPAPAAAPARARTVKRAVAPARRAAAPSKVPPAPVESIDDEPPLDDEELIEEAVLVDEDTGEVLEQDDERPADEPLMVTRKQLTAIAAGMAACGWTDRSDRLRLASAVARRDLSTSKELTREEAGELLDALAWAQSTDDPQAALAGLLEATGGGDGD